MLRLAKRHWAGLRLLLRLPLKLFEHQKHSEIDASSQKRKSNHKRQHSTDIDVARFVSNLFVSNVRNVRCLCAMTVAGMFSHNSS